jgi:hypothetical protein
MRRSILGFIMAVLALSVSFSGAAAQVPSIGERAQGNGLTLTVNGVSTSNGDSLFTPDAGNIYLVVDITMENSTNTNPSHGNWDFSLKCSDGREYQSEIFGVPRPDITSGTLELHDILRGNLAFEVPSAAQGCVLSYRRNGSRDAAVRIRVN